jgi:hypothetical protein
VVSAPSAYQGFAACDGRFDLTKEAYLGAFWYGQDFQAHVSRSGTTKDFEGPCWSPWLWWDIDRAGNLPLAQRATTALVGWLLDKAEVLPDDLLVFFSGSKGFHVGCPMPLDAQPALDFNRRARGLAEAVATAAGTMPIDPAVYVKCQPFRAPNSRHARTGLHKALLSLSELDGWSIERIKEAARQPRPFRLEVLPASTSELLRVMWDKTAAAVAVAANSSRPAYHHPEAGGGKTRLNALTLDFLRGGVDQGDRHRLLFSASANLAEFGCPAALAEALLMPSALDCELKPADARRQIALGLRHGGKGADE